MILGGYFMKKALAIVFCIILMVPLSACGGIDGTYRCEIEDKGTIEMVFSKEKLISSVYDDNDKLLTQFEGSWEYNKKENKGTITIGEGADEFVLNDDGTITLGDFTFTKQK